MKRLFLATATLLGLTAGAQAADMAAKAPYYKAPVVAVYDWSGFYLGVNAGIGLGRDRAVHNAGVLGTESIYLSPQGALGGGQVGYNWQTGSMLGPVVFGLEADIQGAGLSDDRTNLGGPLLPTAYNQRIDWFGTVRGRIGRATGPVLSYVTGGYAYGNVKTSISFDNAGTVFSTNKIQNGWVVGSGVEAALGGNWTGKIEHLYLNMGNNSYAFGPQTLNTEVRENIFRVGLNYRVGGNSAYVPVAAADWTGWYLGGNVGSGTGRDRSSLVKPADLPDDPGANEVFNLAPDGINGGVQLGYNWQAANWVYGLETDIQASSQRDNKTVVGFGSVAYDAKLPWFGTVRGRLGYSVGSTLFYATGGYAYGGVKTKISEDGVQAVNASTTRSGWTAGAGLETPFQLFGLFGPNWTSKAEYLYVDLGSTSNTVNTTVATTSVTEHIFRTGLNYHFNTPVVARY
ncbi:outer membrane protein [Rhodopseudomonas sp. P2A-2r]|uniref:outer membrane protein n=1 Tax=unclassified Rhodopseudomonas TaxID=2638247 RepID=UPI002234BC4D|nr:outer membrane beta-barrel protein [Rhodopseudomonas sp. P2A-2r]UZE50042.1 porin family protein [Rhodopseudomonas sp. P2A-2r]